MPTNPMTKPKKVWMEVQSERFWIRGHPRWVLNGLWHELEAPPTTYADIEAEMGLKGAHAATVNASKSHSKVKSTKQDHFRQIFRICHWLLKEYPDRDQVQLRLTPEIVTHTKSKQRFVVQRVNLNYEKLEPGLIIAFLSMNKTRKQVHRDTGVERTVHQSQVHMRKYLDALEFYLVDGELRSPSACRPDQPDLVHHCWPWLKKPLWNRGSGLRKPM